MTNFCSIANYSWLTQPQNRRNSVRDQCYGNVIYRTLPFLLIFTPPFLLKGLVAGDMYLNNNCTSEKLPVLTLKTLLLKNNEVIHVLVKPGMELNRMNGLNRTKLLCTVLWLLLFMLYLCKASHTVLYKLQKLSMGIHDSYLMTASWARQEWGSSGAPLM